MECKSRTISMFATLLFIASHQQADHISLREYGAPLSTVLNKMEKAGEASYACDSELMREPIMIRATNRPVADLREDLARLLCGKWSLRDGVWHLARDKAKWEETRASEEHLRLKAIEAACDEEAKGIKVFDWTQNEGPAAVKALLSEILKHYQGVPADQLPSFGAGTRNEGSATFELLQTILRSIPASALDTIKPEQSVVFSDQPNRLQRLMPMSISTGLARFKSQQAAMVAAIKKEIELTSPGARFFGGMYSATSPKSIKEVLLRVTRPDARNAYRMRLWVVDGSNNICGEASVSISATVSPPPESLINSADAGEVPVRPEAENLAINLAQCDTQGLNAALFAGSGEPGSLGFSVLAASNPRYLVLEKAAQDIALRPDLHEPLGQLPGDYVLGLADKLDHDVVALLPDEALGSSGRFAQSGRATPGRIVEWLRSLGCQIEAQSGVMLIRPLRSVEAFENRTDRVALTRFLEPYARQRVPRLAEMKAFIENGRITGIIDRTYVRLFSEVIESSIFGSEMSRSTIAIMAGFVRDPISSGQIAVSLNAYRSHVDTILKSAELAETMERESDYFQQTPEAHPGAVRSADIDPTEKFVGGIPGEIDAVLSAQTYNEFAVVDEANGRLDYVTAMSLNMRTAAESEMTKGRQDVTQARFKYFPARLSLLTLNIPALKLESSLFDMHVADAEPALTASQVLELIRSRGG